MIHGDTRQVTCHIGRVSPELRQANRRRQRRIAWPSIGWLIAGLWLGFGITALIMETTR